MDRSRTMSEQNEKKKLEWAHLEMLSILAVTQGHYG